MMKRSRALTSVSMVVLLGVCAPSWAAEQRDMPRQSLAASLDALAAQSHVQVIYAADVLRGLSAPAVKGALDVEEALRRLLAGSGFEARQTADKTFAIVKAPIASRLETVTVTATRTENSTFELPASVTTLTRQQFDDAQAKDMATLLRNVPGVSMGGAPLEAAHIPTIRGYQGPDIILKVDGARRALDATVGTFSPLLLDPNFVRQVDIVRGPSSANHGGGGLGGVIAVETIDAADVLEPGQRAGGWLKAGYRSADVSLMGNAVAAAQADGAGVVGGATLRNYHSIKNGAGGQSLQDGTARNGLLKLTYAPNDQHDFKLGYTRFFDAGLMPTNPSGNDQTTTGYQYVERSQDEVTGRWGFRDAARSWLDASLSAYYTDLKYDKQKRFGAASAAFGTDFTVNAKTVGGALQNTSRFSGLGAGHRLTYGVDGYQDQLTNTSVGIANGVNPDGDMLAVGGFVQDEIRLAPDWTMIATLRHDSYDARASNQPGNSDDHLSPKLAVKWQAHPAFGLFASYGEAFRAPTLTELYNSETRSTSFSNFTPNPTLRPEVATALEVGATLSLNNLAVPQDSLKAKLTLFDEQVDDLINSKVIGTYAGGARSIFQYQNINNAHRWGGELEGEYRLGDWSLTAGYSHLRVKDRNTGENLFSTPDKITAGIVYYADEFWSLRYSGRYVLPQDYDTTVLRRRDSHHVHDIGTSYERDWYRLDFSVTNLFDYAYASYQQGLNTNYTYEEGRSFNLNITAKF